MRLILSLYKRTSLACNFALTVVIVGQLIAYFVIVRKSKCLGIGSREDTSLLFFVYIFGT